MAMPSDPWSSAFGAFGQVGTAAMQKPQAMSSANTTSQGYDNSGWNPSINIGGTQSTSAVNDKSGGLINLSALLRNPVALVAAGVVLYLVLKGR